MAKVPNSEVPCVRMKSGKPWMMQIELAERSEVESSFEVLAVGRVDRNRGDVGVEFVGWVFKIDLSADGTNGTPIVRTAVRVAEVAT
jgi:hypothetical protein